MKYVTSAMQLMEVKSLEKIQGHEDALIKYAKEGRLNKWELKEMISETNNYLRLTEPVKGAKAPIELIRRQLSGGHVV